MPKNSTDVRFMLPLKTQTEKKTLPGTHLDMPFGPSGTCHKRLVFWRLLPAGSPVLIFCFLLCRGITGDEARANIHTTHDTRRDTRHTTRHTTHDATYDTTCTFRVDLHAQANFLRCASIATTNRAFPRTTTPRYSNQACLWVRVIVRVRVPGRGGGRR